MKWFFTLIVAMVLVACDSGTQATAAITNDQIKSEVCGHWNFKGSQNVAMNQIESTWGFEFSCTGNNVLIYIPETLGYDTSYWAPAGNGTRSIVFGESTSKPETYQIIKGSVNTYLVLQNETWLDTLVR